MKAPFGSRGGIMLLFAMALALVIAPSISHAQLMTRSIDSNFNGTSISAGNWIWFNANFKYDGPTDIPVLVEVDNSFLTFEHEGILYHLQTPDALITISPGITAGAVVFDEVANRWNISVPSSFGDDIFLTGLAYPVPVDFSGGINPVTWTATFGTDAGYYCISWKWAAAVYTDFTDDYDLLGVHPLHESGLHAGVPTNFGDFVIGGARGGGGSNYTGSWSGTDSFCFDEPVAAERMTWGRVKALY